MTKPAILCHSKNDFFCLFSPSYSILFQQVNPKWASPNEFGRFEARCKYPSKQIYLFDGIRTFWGEIFWKILSEHISRIFIWPCHLYSGVLFLQEKRVELQVKKVLKLIIYIHFLYQRVYGLLRTQVGGQTTLIILPRNIPAHRALHVRT